jgi:Ca2+-transporting ATPase
LTELLERSTTTPALWISKPANQILGELGVDPSLGLSDHEAASRLERDGPNAIKGKKPKSIPRLLMAQLRSWLVYVLFAAVVITLFMGEYADAVIIVLVIAINAVLGVVQEVKAGKAIAALQRIASPKALVKRGGTVKEVDSGTVVSGDLIILDAGRLVAADLRLVEAANLKIDESALTGESVPSEKDASLTFEDPNLPVGDRVNCAFMSSLVTYGRGVGVVVATGMGTEVGHIAESIDSEAPSKTPLERRLEALGKLLGKLAIAVCAGMFVISWLQGRDLPEMFLTAVSLAVAAIPEGLAAIVAVVLSIGVTAMSKRKAIIRKLPAVETLGSVNIVCTDKTGTLTQNRMTVTAYFTTKGKVAMDSGNPASGSEAQQLAQSMILCSDATYDNGKGSGDPTEIALLAFGDAVGVDRRALRDSSPRVAEAAFDSGRKRMSTVSGAEGKLTIHCKGALGSVLEVCSRVLVDGMPTTLTEAYRQQYTTAADEMSEQALRTLAVAYRPIEGTSAVDSAPVPSEIEKDLILSGLVGMIDPPRIEVKGSVQLAKDAGITTVMITGDHKQTAFAIARELGIADNLDQVVSGRDLDGINDDELGKQVEAYRVFARVSPEHKVRIVRAHKSHGSIVCMTGDGVNDAPSLSAADIGVAMGKAGTDVAKNAADMVLADDNFGTIITAIEQGRNIYNNIRKAVLFLLTSNLGEVVAMFVAIVLGWPAPLLATQLLWINLLTDTLPAVALGMEPGDPDVMKEPPRNPRDGFFAHGAGLRAILGGVLIGIVTMLAFVYGFGAHGFSPFAKGVPDDVISYARTMAFMTIICCQLLYAFAFRSPMKSIVRIGLLSNKALLAGVTLGLLLQLGILGIPFMRSAFKLQQLDGRGWAVVLILGLMPLTLNEIYKGILRLRSTGNNR